ncbi:uncharacterized protein AMSG_10922 [Thecamonas trahens ATCC 50062]|uniref:Sushi domain-containing protein n=1 Tax=Thecamonas trahens ATCC 50062 TaxID=461836 RepID=A0A0L0DST6_THETB|nr:hypothetical protein AMSG_10922 [Thecamonas trahens ATCC 50062]KNC55282.1 hypothetical protein AMSG_10922 [Thecamonas trahens ATCC 50062]|eukprot:XP_013753104.1 hypothetical protein AMSG_10922 [Thecamonas trahens ATCC 50062]
MDRDRGAVQSGSISCSGDTDIGGFGAFNETCTYTCNAGLSLVGIQSQTCLANSQWSGVESPFCSAFSINSSFVSDVVDMVSIEAGSSLTVRFLVRDDSGNAVVSGVDVPLVRNAADGVDLILTSQYLGDGEYSVTFLPPTRAGSHAVEYGLNNLLFFSGTQSSTVIVVPGPASGSRSTLVTEVGASGVLELETSVASTFRIALKDNYDNMVSQVPSIDAVRVTINRGIETFPVNARQFEGLQLVFDVLVENGGTYTLSVRINDDDIIGSPFVLSASTTCLPGSRVLDGTSCVACSPGSYSDTINAVTCTGCPAFTTAGTGASSWRNCSCLPLFWFGSGDRSADRGCEPCPIGAECAGGKEAPQPAPGYSEQDGSFVLCPRPSACAGSGRCAQGYSGSFCTTCSDGYYRTSDGACKACPPNPGGVFAAVVIALVALSMVGAVFVAWVVMRSLEATNAGEHGQKHIIAFRMRTIPVSISMSLVAFQIVSIFAESNLKWSDSSQRVLSVFSAFNINANVVASECAVTSFHKMYALSIAIPFIIVGLVIANMMVLKVLGTAVERLAPLRAVPIRSLVDAVLFLVAPLLYIPLSQSSLALFDCSQLPNGQYVLDADTGVVCFDDAWWAIVPFGVVAILIYVIGVPVYFGITLFLHRLTLFSPHTTARFGSLYRNWRRAYYWGEIANLFKRLAIVVITTMFSKHQLVLIGMLLLILGSSVYIFVRIRPYYVPLYNEVETRLSIAVIAILLLGSASYAERTSSASEIALFVSVIIAIIALCAIAVHSIAMDILSVYRERKRGELPAAERQKGLMNVITAELKDVDADPAVLRSAGEFLATLDAAHHAKSTHRERSSSVDLGQIGEVELDTLDGAQLV